MSPNKKNALKREAAGILRRAAAGVEQSNNDPEQIVKNCLEDLVKWKNDYDKADSH